MFSGLFEHISLKINWEPLTVIFLLVAGREEDQYKITAVFAGAFVEQLLEFSEKLLSSYRVTLMVFTFDAFII